jgi:hypothetical protein
VFLLEVRRGEGDTALDIMGLHMELGARWGCIRGRHDTLIY